MRREIPPITKYLLLINCVAFIITFLVGGGTYSVSGQTETSYTLNQSLGLHFFLANDFHLFQLVTYMFMHGGWAHIFFNMFALWMFGSIIEQSWGPKKYLIFYLVCGLGAGICQEIAQFFEYYMMGLNQFGADFGLLDMFSINFPNSGVTVGASGAIYGLLLAFGMTYPDERLFIIPIPFPIKAKWYVLVLMVLDLLSAISTSSDGVAHLAHLGGMLFGFLMIKYWRRNPYGSYGQSFGGFKKPKNTWKRAKQQANTSGDWAQTTTQSESDWDYNARKQREQEEIDRILDKIRKSGYDSLTKEEKLRLFQQSKK